MPRRRFHLTDGALRDYRKVIYESARLFGVVQSITYRKLLREGFQHIADSHKHLRTQHREDLAEGTDFRIHLVQHHYVVYRAHDDHNVVIAAILPESMDIPTRLKELQRMSRHEIAALKLSLAQER